MTTARFTAAVGAGRRASHLTLDDHRLMRFVGTLQYAACAAVLLALIALPDPNPSDQTPFVILAAIGSTAAFARWSAQRSSTPLSRLTNLGAILYVGAIIAVARPIGATPFLMLLPLLSTAYFLGRHDLALAGGLMVLTLLAALGLNPGVNGTLGLELVPTCSVVAMASVLMVLLRERVDLLIGDLERTASTDGLTGLSNRTSWHKSFTTEMERARRTGAPLSIAVFDLDRFKAINDCLGHAEGDKALIRFSSLLASECRTFDIAGRLGGEEFGLLLVGANADGARAFAERLRGRLELVTRHDLTAFTVSTGIAELDVHAEDAAAMMLAADRALYRAKEEGRDRVIIAELPTGVEAVEGQRELSPLDVLGQTAEQLSDSVTLKLEPQPQAATTFGFSTLNPAPVIASTKSITEPST